MEVKICGRVIGTASGWDEVGDQIICFYDFEPAGIEITKGDLTVDFENGLFQIVNDAGDVTVEMDFVPILAGMAVTV